MERNIPIVQFNRVDKRLKTPKIVIDDAMLAEKATEHLIEQGYKKIYHLSGPSNMSISHNRSNGFRNAMKKHNLTCGARNIIDSGIFIEDGKIIAEKLIKKGDIPDAFFCFNDPVAIGAIETFKEHKYEIPKDIAFVGFTESPISIYMSPRLTTVQQPTEEIGTKAALSLLRIIQEGKKETDETITCYGIINIRESSIRA